MTKQKSLTIGAAVFTALVLISVYSLFRSRPCEGLSATYLEALRNRSVTVVAVENGNQKVLPSDKQTAFLKILNLNKEKWSRSWHTAPSGNVRFELRVIKQEPVTLHVGQNFIGNGWCQKSLSVDETKTLRSISAVQ